ncbi:hypothetical protein SS50377_27611 [Spironucleus salmonicida]|uniref:Uncharacterized protein n=1 Tax=Spironucleus salmonicida TaxID=348837 RepID=V6LPS9_9EUKA|nr:hypothetical protein SS50377_27611 [Spironucleus salmonicida]|eukprot:EST46610.1 Hypothetical protein SS50377_13415 [Spironucleus salmonicida]
MGCGTNNASVTDKSSTIQQSRSAPPPKGAKKEVLKYVTGRIFPVPSYSNIGQSLPPMNSVAFGVLSTIRPRRASLTPLAQAAVDQIAVAAAKFQTYADVNISRDELPNVIDCFSQDFPEVFWVHINIAYASKEGQVIRVDFDKFDYQMVSKRFNQLKDICSKVLEGKQITSAFLACYEEILQIQSDIEKHGSDHCLIDRKASPAAIAKALQLLLLKCDIPAVVLDSKFVAFKVDQTWSLTNPSERLSGINCDCQNVNLEGLSIANFESFPAFCPKVFGRYAAILASQGCCKTAEIIVKASAADVQLVQADFVEAISAVGTGHVCKIVVCENNDLGLCGVTVTLGDGDLVFEIAK